MGRKSISTYEKRGIVMSAPQKQFLIGRRKPFAFCPPRNNRFLIWLTKRLLPLMLRLTGRIVSVEVSEEDLAILRKLKGQRVVLTPSHSKGSEECILFHLSKLLGWDFNYLAAKEVFEWRSPIGWLLQRLGAYSVVRGIPDRDSFRKTRQLLVEGKRWLVIFPEGHTCWQNDTVLPFQQGVAQLGFWAYKDLTEKGERPPLLFIPIAIKHVYLKDMRREIDRSLRRLERRLLPTSNAQPLSLYKRLRSVGEAVVSANEKEYNVHPRKGATLDERIQHVKEQIVSRVAAALDVSPRPEQPLLDRIRYLLNVVDQIVCCQFEGQDYKSQLHHRHQEEVRMLYDDLGQVLRFVALRDGYVRETLTSERFADVIGLLELEVFGRRWASGPRRTIVKLGEPLDLKDCFQRYQTDKRGTLQEVTTMLESSVRRMLADLSRVTEAIETKA
jgi:hypothetical protein